MILQQLLTIHGIHNDTVFVYQDSYISTVSYEQKHWLHVDVFNRLCHMRNTSWRVISLIIKGKPHNCGQVTTWRMCSDRLYHSWMICHKTAQTTRKSTASYFSVHFCKNYWDIFWPRLSSEKNSTKMKIGGVDLKTILNNILKVSMFPPCAFADIWRHNEMGVNNVHRESKKTHINKLLARSSRNIDRF